MITKVRRCSAVHSKTKGLTSAFQEGSIARDGMIFFMVYSFLFYEYEVLL